MAQAVAGPAVRLALGGVRGQRVRLGLRVRRVSPDRDPGAARRAGPGVGAERGRAGGGGRGRGAARPVGGVPPQAAGDDGHGPDPVRGADEHSRRVRARLAQLRPAAGGIGHRRRGQDRLQRGQRRLPEGARAAGAPAHGERPVRVHHLDRHRGRAAARRGRDRVLRPGDHACWPMRSATCSRPRGSARSAGRSRVRPEPAHGAARTGPLRRHGSATCSTGGATSWPTRGCARCSSTGSWSAA